MQEAERKADKINGAGCVGNGAITVWLPGSRGVVLTIVQTDELRTLPEDDKEEIVVVILSQRDG